MSFAHLNPWDGLDGQHRWPRRLRRLGHAQPPRDCRVTNVTLELDAGARYCAAAFVADAGLGCPLGDEGQNRPDARRRELGCLELRSDQDARGFVDVSAGGIAFVDAHVGIWLRNLLECSLAYSQGADLCYG